MKTPALTLAGACALAVLLQQPAAAGSTVASQIAPVFADLADKTAPGCTVGIVQDGKPAPTGAYGALRPDTVFNIASVSKQFTAFAILLLEQQGKLSLDDSVRRYVPELGAYADPVRIRHLLHHTGGLRDFAMLTRLGQDTANLPFDLPTGLRVLLRQTGAEIAPGVEQTYSNSGYLLLGLIVERITGSMQDFLQRTVFDPLQMRDTRLLAPVAGKQAVQSYRAAEGKFTPVPAMPQPIGAGGIFSTVGDMQKWAANYWTGKAGGHRVMQRMLATGALDDGTPIDYAGGLEIATYRGVKVAEHGGSIEGFRTRFLVAPQFRFATILLCNRSDASPGDRADRIVDTLLAAKLTAKPAVPESVQFDSRNRITPDAARIGAYREPKGAEYLELKRDGTATLLAYRGATLPIRQLDGHMYVTEPLQNFPIYLAFAPDRVSMSYGGYRDEFAYAPSWTPEGDLQRFVGSFWSDELQNWLRIRMQDGALTIALGSTTAKLQPGIEGELVWGRGALGVPPTGPVDVIESRMLGLRGVRFVRRAEPAPN